MSVLFWVATAVLALALMALVVAGLRRPRVPAEAPDLALYRGQLDELARDVAAGRLAPADHDAARLEIERRLLAAAGAPPVASGGTGRRGPLTMGLAVLILGGGYATYLALGAPHLPDQPLALRADERAAAAARLRQAQMIEEMVAGLAARLAAAPDDLAGWQRLGRSYMVLGRFPAAAEAFAKAAELAPENVDILLAWAEALLPPVRAAGPPPAPFDAVMARVTAVQPDNPRALFMRGEAAARSGRPAEARRLWRRLLARLPADSPLRQPLAERVAALPAADQ
ncbi:MAG: c-type cytochrome biogenesis protein CcmI [Thalassobaculaceae bacterium]